MKKKVFCWVLLFSSLLTSGCGFRSIQKTTGLYQNDFYLYSAADQFIYDQPSEIPEKYTDYKAKYFLKSNYYFKYDGTVHFVTTYANDSNGNPYYESEDWQGTYSADAAGYPITLTFPPASIPLTWSKYYMSAQIRTYDFTDSAQTMVYMIYIPMRIENYGRHK